MVDASVSAVAVFLALPATTCYVHLTHRIANAAGRQSDARHNRS